MINDRDYSYCKFTYANSDYELDISKDGLNVGPRECPGFSILWKSKKYFYN